MTRPNAFAVVACCLAAMLLSAADGADTSADNRLSIPDVCSISAPGKGWVWKAVQEFDPEKGGAYVCSAEGKPGKVILRIDTRKLEKDAERIAALKVHFNGLHEQLQKLGCTDVKGKRPNLTPPIGTDIDYFLFGKTPKGANVYFAAHTIFKDHTFLVQAVAPSLEQAQKLEEVEKTLK